VLAHPPAVPDLPDGEPDRGLAGECALLDPSLDLGERALGRGEEVVAFAGALRRDERVSADDEPLARRPARARGWPS
jgi:hypothetical protein